MVSSRLSDAAQRHGATRLAPPVPHTAANAGVPSARLGQASQAAAVHQAAAHQHGDEAVPAAPFCGAWQSTPGLFTAAGELLPSIAKELAVPEFIMRETVRVSHVPRVVCVCALVRAARACQPAWRVGRVVAAHAPWCGSALCGEQLQQAVHDRWGLC